MQDYVDDEVLLRELYPDLTGEERIEVKEFLDAYCRIIFHICEREEQEREAVFDEPAPVL